ncbi:hypothetical protein D3C77_651670 [compost metagenome]
MASMRLMAWTAISCGVRFLMSAGLARSSVKFSLLSPLGVFQLMGSMLNDGLPASSLPPASSMVWICSSFRPSSSVCAMIWRSSWL